MKGLPRLSTIKALYQLKYSLSIYLSIYLNVHIYLLTFLERGEEVENQWLTTLLICPFDYERSSILTDV